APVRPGSSARSETAKSPTNVAAAPHPLAAQSPGEVLPLDPPIQSPSASYHISLKMRNQTQQDRAIDDVVHKGKTRNQSGLSDARSLSSIASRSGSAAGSAASRTAPSILGLDLAFKKSRNASAKSSHIRSCASVISSSAFIKARRPLMYWTGPHIPHSVPPGG